MIRNNTLFSPWLVPAEKPLGGRMLWTFEFLTEAMTRHNISFPDVAFYLEARSQRPEREDAAEEHCTDPASTCRECHFPRAGEPAARLTDNLACSARSPLAQEDDSCIACNAYKLPVPAITWFRHQPTYLPFPDVDEKNDLILLAPTTYDVDQRLFSYPWQMKADKLFFRGGRFCHPPEAVAEHLDKARVNGVIRIHLGAGPPQWVHHKELGTLGMCARFALRCRSESANVSCVNLTPPTSNSAWRGMMRTVHDASSSRPTCTGNGTSTSPTAN